MLFLLGASTWVVSNELPSWTGVTVERPALLLLAAAALTSVAFLHFAFIRARVPRAALAATGLLAEPEADGPL